jgi:hypothetical protein
MRDAPDEENPGTPTALGFNFLVFVDVGNNVHIASWTVVFDQLVLGVTVILGTGMNKTLIVYFGI